MKQKHIRIKISETSKNRKHSDISKQKISNGLYRYHNSTPLEKRIKRNLRSRLNKALQGNYKTGSAVRDLGCSIEELKKYLESKFQDGMTWDNYGQWHIDHIRPLCSFNLQDPEELKKVCHYSNLQPLWAKDNLDKRNKDGTFRKKF
jgi:hypothetical protein